MRFNIPANELAKNEPGLVVQYNAHMAQVVDKESAEWVLEAKQREVLDPLPAGAAEDPMTQTKTDLVPLIIDGEKAKQAYRMCKETAVGLPTSHIIQALNHMHVVSYDKIHGSVGLVVTIGARSYEVLRKNQRIT